MNTKKNNSNRRLNASAYRTRLTGEEFYAPGGAYGRITTPDGTQYLYDRSYILFSLKRPGEAAEPYAGPWPPDVAEEICFGDERERTRHAAPVRDPWEEQSGWIDGRWRKQASPRRRIAA